MKFKNDIHIERFIDLMVTDNTYEKDKERISLFYIIAGNDDLFQKRNHIYDFKCHSIKHCLNNRAVDFSSSSAALIRLGFNLYNNYKCNRLTPCELLSNLDNNNFQLAVGAMQLRFQCSDILCFDIEEEESQEIEL